MAEKKGIVHVIDDEPIIHDVLNQLLSSEGYEVVLSSSGEEALEKHSSQFYAVTLLDLLMPGLDGIEVLRGIKRIDPQAVIIIITAYASVESAISAMKMGAYDYIQKPFKHDELLLIIERALEHKSLQDENIRLRDALDRKFAFENIIGRSQPMQRIFELIRATAPTRSTILIQGESGTGKELVARAIHQNSDRRRFPFVVVNSGALPPDLLESHLFGHVKGAFTGAVSQKNGLFETADRGSIFFDEISTVGFETQAKLLRVMQDKEFMRLGGTKTIRVDARIIAATNTDLEELIERKAFRQDLFYRLNVIKIELPPLRERKDDIPLLVKHFIDIYRRENEKEIEGITDDVLEILEDYHWPGNVRELENLIERAVVLSKSKFITRNTLPPFLLDRRPGDRDIAAEEEKVRSFKEQTQHYQR
ncbi:MAG: Fis family transcriptional regulator, partial [Candidatus Aminicenantes bacterium RBG_19FT_COMBO_58_17]